MQDKDKLAQAKNYVYALLARRMYTTKEIRAKLTQREYPDEIINEVISTMEKFGYLNDKVFTEEWINSRMQFKPKGKAILQRELGKKGIDKSTIDNVLDETIDESKELEMALDIAQKKMRSYKNDDLLTARRKLHGFLLRRGFSFDVIKKVIGEVVSKE